MEGLVDPEMRETLTDIGGFDRCVTEFVRVSDLLLPAKAFFRLCPELKTEGQTRNKTPVAVQLLGGKPAPMAENAARAAFLGAPSIDINFGCPAKTVNRHDGGASLLKSPHRLFDIVSAVRQAVPDNIPVTAKIRLGFDDKSLALENALATQEAGAAELVVHARTKKEGYAPPAHWEWIAKIREALDITVVANGDIWDINSYQRCLDVSGCSDVMIGRGAIRCPDLGLQIYHYNRRERYQAQDWPQICATILSYVEKLEHRLEARYLCARLKQWVGLLSQNLEPAANMFQTIKRQQDLAMIRRTILGECA